MTGSALFVRQLAVAGLLLLPFEVRGQSVSLNWLDGTSPASRQGVSWGVPWPKGKLKPGDPLTLAGPGGKRVPVQSWPLAYWPDGSIKWTGNAVSAAPDSSGPLELSPGTAAAPATPIQWKASQYLGSDPSFAFEVNTGAIRCRFSRQGSSLIQSLYVGDRKVLQDGKLVLILEDRSEYESKGVLREEEFTSRLKSVTLEQAGPVRLVVKVEGTLYSAKSGRSWLPFTTRLYFYAGLESIRIVHSFIFDGDEQKDFIRGLGLSFTVPFQEELQNRHVRFAGDGTGMWAEPVRLLPGFQLGGGLDRRVVELRQQQLAGKRVPNISEFDPKQGQFIEDVAVWDAFKLTQLTPNGFSIDKRTGAQSSWLHVTNGHRSLGLAYLGDASGGIAVGVKKFWQKYPASIEITGASAAAGEMKVWLWSPEGAPMDLRHYDTKPHGLPMAYEDIEPGYSTPNGVANTAEMTLWAFSATPSNGELLNMAKAASQPSMLVCTPQYYHSIPVFGIWSLPDRSTAKRKPVEDELDREFEYFRQDVEQRYWYGFWNYGDVGRSYDAMRHTWRYDIGGWGWDNTELMPDVFLWYTFLRTGRADVFRMAEAMTRHTSEVDVYHLGRFAGLGSRHNVSHWGDSAKEVRVSHAGLKRFYYYLTTDERTGDLMREVVDSDFKHTEVFPLRKLVAQGRYPAQVRWSVDWFAFVANWMTEWERTGNTLYRDKIVTGMKSLAAMPHGLLTNQLVGYDPKSGVLYDEPEFYGASGFVQGGLFAGPEIAFELRTLIDVPEFWKTWLESCEQPRGGARTLAYAAYIKKDAALGRAAWEGLLSTGGGRSSGASATAPRGAPPAAMRQRFPEKPVLIQGPDVLNPVQEIPMVDTGGDSQWGLNVIEALELAGEYLPEPEKR